jgi:hypothetical protein
MAFYLRLFTTGCWNCDTISRVPDPVYNAISIGRAHNPNVGRRYRGRLMKGKRMMGVAASETRMPVIKRAEVLVEASHRNVGLLFRDSTSIGTLRVGAIIGAPS